MAGQTTEHRVEMCACCQPINANVVKDVLSMDENLMEKSELDELAPSNGEK
jgi:hypothetical protein